MTNPGRRAFTLPEVLTAIAVTMMLLLVLVMSANETSRAWLQGLARKERQSGARAILQFIARDLQMAVLPADFEQRRVEWLNAWKANELDASKPIAADTGSVPQLIANIPDPNATGDPFPEYLNPGAIFLQTPILSEARVAQTAEAGYFVKWTGESNGRSRCQLNRFITSASSDDFIYDNVTTWLSKTVIDNQASASAPDFNGWFLDSVLGLWVRALDPNGNAIIMDAAGSPTGYGFDSRKGYSYTDPETDATVRVAPPALPAMVELTVLLVDSATARRIENPLTDYRAVNPDRFHEEIDDYIGRLPQEISAGLSRYTTRVRLKNAK